MELTLSDLNGLLRDRRCVPSDWWQASDLPFAGAFDTTKDGSPRFVVLRLGIGPHWALVRDQFPSLRKVEGVGQYTMSDVDLAKMRLLFGGGW